MQVVSAIFYGLSELAGIAGTATASIRQLSRTFCAGRAGVISVTGGVACAAAFYVA